MLHPPRSIGRKFKTAGAVKTVKSSEKPLRSKLSQILQRDPAVAKSFSDTHPQAHVMADEFFHGIMPVLIEGRNTLLLAFILLKSFGARGEDFTFARYKIFITIGILSKLPGYKIKIFFFDGIQSYPAVEIIFFFSFSKGWKISINETRVAR